MIEEKIKKILQDNLEKLGVDDAKVSLEHPDEISNGDYSTSLALAYSKELKMKPRELAEKIVRYLSDYIQAGIVKNQPEEIERVEIAGPGFINFYLSRSFFTQGVLSAGKDDFGKNQTLKGKKIIVEYTNANLFKLFHIGHLMDNAIGEALSRVIEFQGADVIRACYQGDVGLHVAKTLYGVSKVPEKSDYVAYLGEAYAFGSKAYEEGGEAKLEIVALNKKIFERSDKKINELYDKGREASLRYYEGVYKKLGTKFDTYNFESVVAPSGVALVKEFLTQDVFEVSDGAVVFRGDKHGLHTRVFINSEGLPTYEAKELGLTKKKFEEFNPDVSIVVTANEQSAYFEVVLEAMRHIDTNMAERTKHIAHGMLRLPTGKMSSRTGDVITGDSFIASVEAMVHKKLEERELETAEKNKIAEIVAIGAIKYSIVRQAIGSDIIFDLEKSISFEGDSGPYLQYAYVRAKSILTKAEQEGIQKVERSEAAPQEVSLLERLLVRFPEVVLRAGEEYAPHLVATFLIELAGAFNAYYAKNKIVDVADKTSPYKVALTSAFATVMKNGLYILGIKAPEKM